ncbi:unnamed protein product [Dovyalis caffra]|uniref:Uncharacterized protein n=1 Tax=Dovyalis caffra TaxID=77055 RepID=A0AAV1R280_9ROSI|nr:unnamed protein product [Dovyalis caffra]
MKLQAFISVQFCFTKHKPSEAASSSKEVSSKGTKRKAQIMREIQEIMDGNGEVLGERDAPSVSLFIKKPLTLSMATMENQATIVGNLGLHVSSMKEITLLAHTKS